MDMNLARRRSPFLRVVIAAVAGLACGGGGGGGTGSDPLTATFDPPTAVICQQEGHDQFASVSGRLSAEPRNASAAVMNLDATVFDIGWSFVSTDGSRDFSVELRTRASLPVGSHEGTITFDLCHDSGCAQREALAGIALPYRVQVLPPLTLAVSIDGTPVEGNGGVGNDYQVVSGQTVTVTANSPVTWTPDDRAHAVDVTDTTWTGTIDGASNSLPVRILAVAQCGGATSWDVWFTIVEP